jgi:hypothetical protein
VPASPLHAPGLPGCQRHTWWCVPPHGGVMVVHDPAVVDVVGPRRRHRQPARRRRPHPRGQPRGACRGDPTLGCLPRTGVASVNLSQEGPQKRGKRPAHHSSHRARWWRRRPGPAGWCGAALRARWPPSDPTPGPSLPRAHTCAPPSAPRAQPPPRLGVSEALDIAARVHSLPQSHPGCR